MFQYRSLTFKKNRIFLSYTFIAVVKLLTSAGTFSIHSQDLGCKIE